MPKFEPVQITSGEAQRTLALEMAYAHAVGEGQNVNSNLQLIFRHGDQVDSALFTNNNSTGGTDKSRSYTAYGDNPAGAANVPATLDTFYNYGGHYEDGTGLVYMKARYYDPNIGSFISPDSIIPDPTNPIDYNRYLYARGNPLSNNDPSGHVSCNDAACYNAHGLFDNGNGIFNVPGAADLSGAGGALKAEMLLEAGIEFRNNSGVWSDGEKDLVLEGIVAFANWLSGFNNETGLILVNQQLGEHTVQLFRMDADNFWGAAAHVGLGRFADASGTPSGANSMISLYNSFFNTDAYARGGIVHELAHVADYNAIPFKGLSNSKPLDLVTNYGGYINGLRTDAQLPFWDVNGILARKDLASETYAERVGIMVFSLPIYGNVNPYAQAVGVR